MFCSILIFLLLVQEELGRPCLPFDETNVPNCFDFVDPVMKIPVYVEHATSKLK